MDVLDAILGQQLYVTLKLNQILVALLIVLALVGFVIRHRAVTEYSRVPQDLPEDEDHEQWLEEEVILSNTEEEDSAGKLSAGSYFDEFLSAIRVFGYLDRKVFYELTRHMRTVRFEKGESVRLKDLDGFAVVIDGRMGVYCEDSRGNSMLLTEAHRAAHISSLSSILSLFTDIIELPETPSSAEQSEFRKVNDSVVTTAIKPSTVVVVPHSAFRQLTRKYPSATAQIVQIILLRWSQVTFRTCQRYLNLTRQVFDTEHMLNLRVSRHNVPDVMREAAVQRLRSLARECPGEACLTLQDQSKRFDNPSFPGDLAPHRSGGLDDGPLRVAIISHMFSLMGLDSRVQHPSSPRDEEYLSRGGSPEAPCSDYSQYSSSSSDAQAFNGIQIPPSLSRRSSTGENDTTRILNTYDSIISEASRHVEIAFYREGEIVSKAGQRTRGLIFVLDGELEVGHKVMDKRYESLCHVKTGEITGYLETISSYAAFVDVQAKRDTCVAILSKSTFEHLAEKYPWLYIGAAKSLTTLLARPIVQLDFALEWVNLKSGRTVFRQGTHADALYFVLNGRLRALRNGEIVGEFGQGSSVGELQVLVGENHTSTVVAVRETEVARFPRSLIESLARDYPSITFEMSRMVAAGMARAQKEPTAEFRTVAVLPTNSTLPVQDFAERLASAFRATGKSVSVLTNASALTYLGRLAFHRMGDLKLKAYLADLEDQVDIILYVADVGPSSSWTRTCVYQSDCVLLLADAAANPTFGDYERLIVKSRTTSRTHLILLHADRNVPHDSTRAWLRRRPWVAAHHHIQLQWERGEEVDVPEKRLGRLHRLKERVQDGILQRMLVPSRRKPAISLRTQGMRHKNDFLRLARVLSGQSVGLVLGGGGARGISQIGVIQALEELGVPVDMVGGTSIGSFIGALYAREYELLTMLGRAHMFSQRVSSLWRILSDITYPATAWTTGHAFNRAVWKAFGNSRIEDYWLRYFTNTTNLTHSKMEIHQRGYSWRFIRASMSLAGLVPPIEHNGQMLLDGGYVDNLPVGEMKRMGARYIIAVDVGAVDDTTPIKYGDTLSGFGALINRWNPFSSSKSVPNMAEIQQRLTYVSSVKALEEAKMMRGVIYLRPPIDNYATLDFGKFDEIVAVGHRYATEALEGKMKSGELPQSWEKERPKLKFRRYSI